MIDTNVYTENSIRTFTGKVFDITILDLDSIDIEDIAHALSYQPRFGGHLEKMYSVAQHSVHVASMAGNHVKMEALLHDAAEAYIGDMPSPFKKLMPDYKVIENNIMIAIANKFGLVYPLPPSIKDHDIEMLHYEWNSFVLKNDDNVVYMTPEEAKKAFLDEYYKIKNGYYNDNRTR